LRPTKWGSGVSLHGSNLEPLMSAMGQKQTWQPVSPMSVPPKADIRYRDQHVRFVPEADKVHRSNRNVIQSRYLL